MLYEHRRKAVLWQAMMVAVVVVIAAMSTLQSATVCCAGYDAWPDDVGNAEGVADLGDV